MSAVEHHCAGNSLTTPLHLHASLIGPRRPTAPLYIPAQEPFVERRREEGVWMVWNTPLGAWPHAAHTCGRENRCPLPAFHFDDCLPEQQDAPRPLSSAPALRRPVGGLANASRYS
ncbi:hypothetical protein ACIP5N_21245 [Streptomyces sp. NPDC088768]|uniref:hypothetical protein n=1 Tax=Streptomyces sp. NPDC088768 TaxID=3365894 RepID=UPI00380ED1F7